MGSDVAEVDDILPSPRDIKVHRVMCMELIKFVTRVSKLRPDIEAARPRCSSGIEALVQLNNAILKAKALVQYCSESSKLYLALTGDAILVKCKKSRNLLEQSLSQMQNMVPVVLAKEISLLVAELRSVIFSLDPSEEEAGKVVKELLHQYTPRTESGEEHAIEATQVAMRRLHIISSKALLIEKRSIKKLLDRVGEGELTKRKILSCFLSLLNKYGKSSVTEQTENGSLQREDSFGYEVESRLRCRPDDAQRNFPSSSLPPDEFKCPLSSRLMYDPVVIASGQTYERFWIQKWFAEGHDTCPETGKKLAHLSLTSNNSMKDLISRWSAAHGVGVPDSSMKAAVFHSWESSSTSIASLSSSMNDLSLPIDFSNLSLGFSDVGPGLDSSNAKRWNEFNVVSLESKDNFYKVQSGVGMQEMDLNPLIGLSSLSWESQCNLVGSISNIFEQKNQACNWMSSEDFVQTLVKYLKDAQDFHDLNAQKLGCRSLLAVFEKCRSSSRYLNDDAFELLASFLGTEVSKEALDVLEVLSCHKYCQSKIAASGALTTILAMLDDKSRELYEPSIKILSHLSENNKIGSLIAPSEFIPKLIPFLEDTILARDSVIILKNLCISEDARVSVTETEGCISSVVKLLESDSREDQEHAVALLLFLCSQRDQYCRLVMDEGVIPGLVIISVNGNNKGKAMALELLRVLRSESDNIKESQESDVEIPKASAIDYTQQKSRSKTPGFFGNFFSKHGSAAAKSKN